MPNTQPTFEGVTHLFFSLLRVHNDLDDLKKTTVPRVTLVQRKKTHNRPPASTPPDYDIKITTQGRKLDPPKPHRDAHT